MLCNLRFFFSQRFLFGRYGTADFVLQLGAASDEGVHILLDFLTVCIQIIQRLNPYLPIYRTCWDSSSSFRKSSFRYGLVGL